MPCDHRDCHIRPDLILIYRKPDDASLELVRLGSHSELGLLNGGVRFTVGKAHLGQTQNFETRQGWERQPWRCQKVYLAGDYGKSGRSDCRSRACNAGGNRNRQLGLARR